MTVALRSSSLLGALIPVDNAPVDALLKSDFGKYLAGMREVESTGIRKQVQADHILSKYEDAPAIRQFLMTNLVKSPNSGLLGFRIPIQTLASSLANMGDFPFRDPVAACHKGPTLFVRGTRSHYIPDEVLPVIGQFFPRFNIQDIDCGHWIMTERPDLFKLGKVAIYLGRLSDANQPSGCNNPEAHATKP
ncbi:MAG: hypothetical protein L6R36_003376 [Xanthoria steineri]|nr:MAG: hypothetical protein L6R36_003376 [Xanthoria steineri]